MKSYTDIEQSKRLAEILPIETADMYYPSDVVSPKFGVALSISNNVPCWSLTALLDVLPNGTDVVKDKADTENEKYMCTTEVKDDIISTFGNNPVDACFEMILKLKELNLL